jgi:hypothetical protein
MFGSEDYELLCVHSEHTLITINDMLRVLNNSFSKLDRSYRGMYCTKRYEETKPLHEAINHSLREVIQYLNTEVSPNNLDSDEENTG